MQTIQTIVREEGASAPFKVDILSLRLIGDTWAV